LHRVEQIMGTAISIETRRHVDLEPVFDWLRWADATFSTFRPDSAISRGDRSDPEVRAVLQRCAELRDETEGAFDGDPMGYVKGWAAERAAALIDAECSVNAGGDVRVKGRWRVGIQHPLERDKTAAVIELEDAAAATSGTYERGAHIRGARPDILSVTIVGPDLGTADAYATAACVNGPDWTARLRGYEAMTILANGTVLETRGFAHLRNP
jgi:thiamine biosynthesis lipoprotein